MRFNRNIVECKYIKTEVRELKSVRFNRNIVEYKCLSIYLIYQVEEG